MPPLEEVADFLNKYRRELGYTIDQIEEKMNSQAPHHWFNAESYPSADDWMKIKDILKFPDAYDNAMTDVFLKPSEKQNNPNGANPGDILLDYSDEDPHHPKGDPTIHGMRLPPQPNQKGAFNPNGANPGDVNQDEGLYDIFTDSNIQDAFIEYLERERPELLMPSILDIPTMPHSFAHFAVMPETLVEPLMKAGCAPEVCIKCGKPKVLQHTRIEKTGNEKPMSGKHATNPDVNSPGNREHYYTEVRKYDVDQKEIATFIKERLPKEKIPMLNDKFGETKWKHWIRTDESGASLPSPSEYVELKEILALPDDHDEEMLSTVTVLVDDSGNSNIPIGLKPSCNCNAGFKPGVVIDPFAGSGTVGVVAKKQGKSAILIEINPEYVEIIKSRLEIEGYGINTNVKFVDVASIESMEEDE